MTTAAAIACFIGIMGVGGSIETGNSPAGALVLIAISLPLAIIAYKRERRRCTK